VKVPVVGRNLPANRIVAHQGACLDYQEQDKKTLDHLQGFSVRLLAPPAGGTAGLFSAIFVEAAQPHDPCLVSAT
jgi:hypothetical protein